jgi:hypothetical protein
MRILRILSISLIPLLMLTGITPLGIVYASKPMPASGTIVVGDVLSGPETRTANGNTFLTQTTEVTYTGTLSLTSVNLQKLTIHPNGLIQFHELATATGTVSGVGAGTLILRVAAYLTPDGDVKGTFTILSGTDDLENLKGTFKIGGSLSSGITYSGQIHVDP